LQENADMKCNSGVPNNVGASGRLWGFGWILVAGALFWLFSPPIAQANPVPGPTSTEQTSAQQAGSGQPLTMTALEADKAAQSGEILLLDIRTPDEWAETGIPSSGHAVSMHVPGFLEKLAKLNGHDRGKPVALICARGNRSAFLTEELKKRGFSQIIDVSEGMMGGQHGPGWLARGLAVKKPNAGSDPEAKQ
jgi:rhodanese-related sulfurtransferase